MNHVNITLMISKNQVYFTLASIGIRFLKSGHYQGCYLYRVYILIWSYWSSIHLRYLDISIFFSFLRNMEKFENYKKLFKCEFCDHSCSEKGNMKRHISSIHVKKKSVKCEICDYGFSQNCTLIKHFESVHKKYKPFECEICHKNFPVSSKLKQHIASVREKRSLSNKNFVTTVVLLRVA